MLKITDFLEKKENLKTSDGLNNQVQHQDQNADQNAVTVDGLEKPAPPKRPPPPPKKAGGIDLATLEDYLAMPEEYPYHKGVLDDVMNALLRPVVVKDKKEWQKAVLKRVTEKVDYFDDTLFDKRDGGRVCVLEKFSFNEMSVLRKCEVLRGLCDLAVDENEDVREIIKGHVKENTLEEGLVRLKPCWLTNHNRRYYHLDNGHPSCSSSRIFSVGKSAVRVESSDVPEFEELLERTINGADRRAAVPAKRLRERKLAPLLARAQAAEKRKLREQKREAIRLEAIARWQNSERPRRSASRVTSYAEFDLRDQNNRATRDNDEDLIDDENRRRSKRLKGGEVSSPSSAEDSGVERNSEESSPHGSDSPSSGMEPRSNGKRENKRGKKTETVDGAVEESPDQEASIVDKGESPPEKRGDEPSLSSFSEESDNSEPSVEDGDDSDYHATALEMDPVEESEDEGASAAGDEEEEEEESFVEEDDSVESAPISKRRRSKGKRISQPNGKKEHSTSDTDYLKSAVKRKAAGVHASAPPQKASKPSGRVQIDLGQFKYGAPPRQFKPHVLRNVITPHLPSQYELADNSEACMDSQLHCPYHREIQAKSPTPRDKRLLDRQRCVLSK